MRKISFALASMAFVSCCAFADTPTTEQTTANSITPVAETTSTATPNDAATPTPAVNN